MMDLPIAASAFLGGLTPANNVGTMPFAAPPGQQTGVVKAWWEERGFGFIVSDAGGQDVFVHRSGLLDGQMLAQGSRVSFQTQFDAQKGKVIASQLTGAIAGHVPGDSAILGAPTPAAP